MHGCSASNPARSVLLHKPLQHKQLPTNTEGIHTYLLSTALLGELAFLDKKTLSNGRDPCADTHSRSFLC